MFAGLADIPNRLFKDPLSALLQKEYRSLLRMPRFRVMFGMACVFSVLVFIPMALNSRGKNGFINNNFLVITTLYGLLILSDSLLLNCFGFDRIAAQIYFVSPVPFRAVLLAKNLTAITFVALQSVAVIFVALLLHVATGPLNVINAVAAAAVVAMFFLAAGNLTSVIMPRAIDPTETFRKQAGGKMHLWFLLCAVAMFVLIGLAFLAGWALDTNWAMLGVLGIEFAVGYIVYRVALQSAIERAESDRERLIDSLSKGAAASVMGLRLS
jgi:ABC-2 type transport system permease protein